tara:strand:+ start:447 stop:788 length:342 start_codon:yes stop_codon:yes gene_type:complete
MKYNELREFPTEKKRKLFQKIKKKVTKIYPNATTYRTNDGRYLVSNGIDGFIGEELLLPPANSVWQAWEHAAEYGIKLARNIRRTHPNRFSSERVEAKIMRINKRRGNRFKKN